ncbi:hypothetical protein GJU40_13180 [Bacillus lacus]|uniref:HMA domain-containing protein n=1 Tax=Metabacillus lacus TaxID=1983721 RepID=A0A7X2J0B6_9BACI|nr:heavy metal-associated domain-containing protein [Metabacillus lacus]MRX73095.1 hypothetical protein [Metabacillus lacus]
MTQVTLLIQQSSEVEPVQSIEEILSAANGIERALADVDNGEVKVEYNELIITEDQILAALQQHGFAVSVR